METVEGLEIGGEEMNVGDYVIWQYRGAPYKAQILAIHDKKPMPGEKPKLYGDKQRPSSKRKYLEDSDDSDAENNTPPPKKPLRQNKARFGSPVVDLSDVESSPAKSESTTDRLSSLKQKISLSCSVHLSPQSDLSDLESTPETSELVADRLSSLKQKVVVQTDCKQEVPTGIKQILERLEKKIDLVISQLPQSTHGDKAEGSGRTKSPLKVKQEQTNEKFITDAGINLLSLRATAPDKYALAILTALFTDEEMGRSCYATTSRSTKPPLPAEKIALLEECIDYKFGKGSMNANRHKIIQKCNQKCLDKGNPNKRIKKEKAANDLDKEN